MRWLVAVAAFLLLACGAAPAGAGPRFTEPGPKAVLQSGDTIRVAWSLANGLDDFGEMEILLSLDGGRTFPVRLTRDLEPDTTTLDWRVPALPTDRARLALRAGDGDEPAAERILLVSEEFSIEVGPSSRLEPTLPVRGEWRTREALDGDRTEAPLDPMTWGPAVPALHLASDLPEVSAPPRPQPVADGGASLSLGAFESVAVAPRLRPPPPLSRTPVDIPRRE